MSLQLLKRGLRLRAAPRVPARPARALYSLPPEDPVTPVEGIFGVSVITLSFFLPIMWYYWDMKRNGLIKTRSDE